MSASAIQHLERAAQLDDIDTMRFEIRAALGSLKQQPSVLNDLDVHARIEAKVRAFDSAAQAAIAMGVPKQTLHAVRNGDRPPPPAILRALGLQRVPSGRTLYREI